MSKTVNVTSPPGDLYELTSALCKPEGEAGDYPALASPAALTGDDDKTYVLASNGHLAACIPGAVYPKGADLNWKKHGEDAGDFFARVKEMLVDVANLPVEQALGTHVLKNALSKCRRERLYNYESCPKCRGAGHYACSHCENGTIPCNECDATGTKRKEPVGERYVTLANVEICGTFLNAKYLQLVVWALDKMGVEEVRVRVSAGVARGAAGFFGKTPEGEGVSFLIMPVAVNQLSGERRAERIELSVAIPAGAR